MFIACGLIFKKLLSLSSLLLKAVLHFTVMFFNFLYRFLSPFDNISGVGDTHMDSTLSAQPLHYLS